jgi:hypothetical protein
MSQRPRLVDGVANVRPAAPGHDLVDGVVSPILDHKRREHRSEFATVEIAAAVLKF